MTRNREDVPPMSLSGSQRATLAAMVGRLIPGDAASPGALEAGVPEFVETQLAEYFAGALHDVAAGLDGLDEAAEAVEGRGFTELAAEQQDALLGTRQIEPFFELVLQLTIDGFLCDPRHGGNRDLVGWRLVGYPGVTMAPSEADQQVGTPIPFHGATVGDWQATR